MNEEWTISFLTSINERYYSDLNKRATSIVDAAGLEVLDYFGGGMVGEDPDAPGTCDTGFDVIGTEIQVRALADQLHMEVNRPIDVRKCEDEDKD